MDQENKTARKRSKVIDDKAVRALAAERGIPEEEALFSLMRHSTELCGAMSDWDDVRPITISVIRELLPFLSAQAVYELVQRVLTLYTTHVISIYQAISDVKRLAYFVNEMIESCLEIEPYEAAIRKQYNLTGNDDRVVLRGIVLRRIARDEVIKLFLTNRPNFFKAENFCASRYLSEGTAELAHPPVIRR